ncbi:DUF4198 domain-containing protein [Marinobacterium sediminicola]|uniref:Uncharacterized conserved protein, contains GH25 family domain n=1 Tax=Marinobacterium sediminicola TaxID=518898 RepID=A0ABY1RY51_9GAMM|nr:DUF4198 domain-containing protein [Marinobacterium sediminicola]ULG68632.1 DUF4198 domain-containing protein [Marinobacterium sediminicola]SMR73155.1 Uncharacterized conserved protein, contains GH25 family domain [Marinobacterium sediminicola]
MNIKRLSACALLALGLGAVATAQAHRAWMLPSATVLSGDNAWVTVDGAVSNSLFYFEHHPLRLERLEILSPTGAQVEAQNRAEGRYRSMFDVELTEEGTYTLQMHRQGAFARYQLDGEPKRWSGPVNRIDEIPANATDLQVSEIDSRMQVFVTRGEPSNANFKPTGQGIELLPLTHPNDLVTEEPVSFQFLVDGNPAEGLSLLLIRDGIRYRDQVGEIELTTNAEGRVELVFDEPGMYWLEVELEQPSQHIDGAKRRLSYSATLEVLPL